MGNETTAELPKLPECFKHPQVYGIGWILYTADQMNAHYLTGIEAGKASRAGSEPVAWMIVDEAGDVRKAKPGGKDAFPVYREAIAPAAAAEPSEPVQEATCTTFNAPAMPKITERARLMSPEDLWNYAGLVGQRTMLLDRERAASLVASEDTKLTQEQIHDEIQRLKDLLP